MKGRGARKSDWVKGLLLLLVAVAALAAVYTGGRWLETKDDQPEARGDFLQRQEYEATIQVDGASYRQRKNVTAILLMGVDRDAGTAVSGYRNGGQADFLQLLVIDSGRKLITRLPIDRDTMTPITILGVLGDQSGVRTAQISLSHGFGDGKEQSCELTASAVSNLLLGTPIDLYMAMNMDGISVLNDAVGGVTVTLEDDFSALDASMTQGRTMTLVGDQAEIFVRSRRSVGVGTNAARMARQQQYIAQLTAQLDARIQADQGYIGSLYDALEPYLTTNISRGTLINQAWTSRAFERAVMTLPGEHQVSADGFMQFHADEAALKQAVLELFYQEVK